MLSWADWHFLYFDHRGRITRQAFWFGCVPLLLVVGVISWPVAMFELTLGGPLSLHSIVLGVLYTLLAWPAWCLAAKRRHDRGGSGIDIIGVVVVAVAGFAFARLAIGGNLELRKEWWALVPSVVTSACFFSVLIPLGVLPGKPGPNKYGPDPLAPSATNA